MQTIASFPYVEAEFTKAGKLHRPAAQPLIADIAGTEATDLVVLAHGWNNDTAEAAGLYERFLTKLHAQILHDAAFDRRLAVLAVLWPSKKFAESELIAGAAAALESQDDQLRRALRILRELADDDASAMRLNEAEQLLPQLVESAAARRRFADHLRALWPAESAETPEDGSAAMRTLDGEELLNRLRGPRPAAPADEGGAAALADRFERAKAAAQQLLNYTTYYVMKERAATVATRGLAPLLKTLHNALPRLGVHLVGHSFGGRLMAAAAAALPPDAERPAPLRSLLLLQAAFSHHGFAKHFDGDRNGFFRSVLTDRHVAGPILVTHTENDKAVGLAYAIASRLARDDASALGDRNDPYGGIGRNGAVHTPEAIGGRLDAPIHSFAPHKIYNLLADTVIHGHSDVANDSTARALRDAIKAVP